MSPRGIVVFNFILGGPVSATLIFGIGLFGLDRYISVAGDHLVGAQCAIPLDEAAGPPWHPLVSLAGIAQKILDNLPVPREVPIQFIVDRWEIEWRIGECGHDIFRRCPIELEHRTVSVLGFAAIDTTTTHRIGCALQKEGTLVVAFMLIEIRLDTHVLFS